MREYRAEPGATADGEALQFVRVQRLISGRRTRAEKGHRMKMYPDDWRTRVTTAVVIAACLIAVKLLGPMVGIDGFWPWMLAVIVGIVLGALVGRLLFRPSSGGPLEDKKRSS